ncbi:MAG: hypothetical protein K2X59_01355 [Sphingomonas sp.]|nr:hypothetical protein [Sphingomonas sp.]
MDRPISIPNQHRGPTLTRHQTIAFEKGKPICVSCPASRWYVIDGKPFCFCIEFRAKMYGGGLGAVTDCDAHAFASLTVGNDVKAQPQTRT